MDVEYDAKHSDYHEVRWYPCAIVFTISINTTSLAATTILREGKLERGITYHFIALYLFSNDDKLFVYYAGVIRILCGYYADIMRILCGYYADIMRILCGYYADIMRILCGYYADIMRILCGYYVDIILCEFYANIIKLSRSCYVYMCMPIECEY